MNRQYRVIFSVIFFLQFLPLLAQPITVSNTMTPTQLVQNVLAGPGVTISNVTFNGVPGTSVNNQIGTFNNGNGSIGVPNGVILATGGITVALGPNNSANASVPVDNNAGADPDLTTLANNTTFDKAILEFDFIPSGDTLRFNYSFASEEYNEYACTPFNDVFGFFISGPGFAGPFQLGAENIALIPGTNVPVAINTVNNGNVGSAGGTVTNCANANPNWNTTDTIYYVDNEVPTNMGFNNIQFDGYTVVLTAFALVQCNQTYHIKIAIADAGDEIYDSGVFLQAGSFSSNALQITGGTLIGDSVTTDTLFTEGCQSAIFFFNRDSASATVQDTLIIGVTGTAIEGTDYTSLPDTVFLGVGELRDSIIFNAIDDGIVEDTETVTLFITYPTPCGLDTISFSLYIQDYPKIIAIMGGDTTLCPGMGSLPVLDPVVTGGFGNYHYLWYPTQDTTDTLQAVLGQTTVFYVNIEDDCGKTGSSNPVTIVVQCPIIIPNVITANDDGTNDVFIIKNIEEYPENEVWFFNRWGTLLYYKKSYQNDWKPRVSDGVYYYVVDDKVDDPFKGFFTVFSNP